MSAERGLELRVGLLVAVCTGLLVAFIVVLGGISTAPTASVHLDVDTSASLKVGSPVRLAGVEAGKVRAISYRGGEVDPATGKPVWVRVTLDVATERLQSLNDRARFYITTQGVLGEKYVEIEPSREAGAALVDGVILQGEPPLRLEMMAARASRLLDVLTGVVTRNEAALEGLVRDAAATMSTVRAASEKVDALLAEGGPQVAAALGQLEAIEGELMTALRSVNTALGDGSELRTVVTRASQIATEVQAAVGPVVGDARGLMSRYDRLGAAAEALLGDARGDVLAILGSAKGVVGDVAGLLAKVKSGQGSLGALLADRELYEDVREMMKDLKRHPWKFIWKE